MKMIYDDLPDDYTSPEEDIVRMFVEAGCPLEEAITRMTAFQMEVAEMGDLSKTDH